jgi:hypothetical protein
MIVARLRPDFGPELRDDRGVSGRGVVSKNGRWSKETSERE